MRFAVRMIMTAAMVSSLLMVFAGCSSEPSDSQIPGAARLPTPEISPPQAQGTEDTPDTSVPEVTPPSQNEFEPETELELEVGPQVGKLAPVFKFTNPDGEAISLSDLNGHYVVLNFWATWCGPCKFEMPLLQELARDEEKASEGLMLLTINSGESADAVSQFMYEHGYSFPVLLDTQRSIARAYNVRAIPTTFFLDKDGIIRDIKVGAFTTEAELDAILENLMN